MNGDIELEGSSDSNDGDQGQDDGKNKAIADRIYLFAKDMLSYVDAPINDNDTVDTSENMMFLLWSKLHQKMMNPPLPLPSMTKKINE